MLNLQFSGRSNTFLFHAQMPPTHPVDPILCCPPVPLPFFVSKSMNIAAAITTWSTE